MEPTQIHHDEHATLWHGDCIETMRLMPAASIDSVVTDPPYALDFMGNEWDRMTPGEFQHWCEEWAAEAFRVLKPGGHMLVFGGTRTFHRLAAGIEDAGFEIRDSIAWLYGSGFPKSLDVSKAIDKARDDTDDILGVSSRLADLADASGVTRRNVDAAMGTSDMGSWWLSRIRGRAAVASIENWKRLRELIPGAAALDDDVWRLNGRKGEWGNERTDRDVTAPGGNAVFSPTQRVQNAGTPTTDAAREWQGWGTALKPAFEPVVVARKPLIGTVAANVLAHGTGALNIDATRIAHDEKSAAWVEKWSGHEGHPAGEFGTMGERFGGSPAGRFPANVILDESQAEALDAMAPNTGGSGKASGPSLTGPTSAGVAFGARNGLQGEPAFYGDTGGASRFFYTAKAPQHERPKDSDGQGHPTVKPVSLMRWLAKLVTPAGGTILEPFAGSGTTIEAALTEGFHVIAIEREAKYIPLCEARMARPMQGELF